MVSLVWATAGCTSPAASPIPNVTVRDNIPTPPGGGSALFCLRLACVQPDRPLGQERRRAGCEVIASTALGGDLPVQCGPAGFQIFDFVWGAWRVPAYLDLAHAPPASCVRPAPLTAGLPVVSAGAVRRRSPWRCCSASTASSTSGGPWGAGMPYSPQVFSTGTAAGQGCSPSRSGATGGEDQRAHVCPPAFCLMGRLMREQVGEGDRERDDGRSLGCRKF